MQSADNAEQAAICGAQVYAKDDFWTGEKNELQIVIMQFMF